MIRYAIKIDNKWAAIGTQFSVDMQGAHLYTSKELAFTKARKYKNQKSGDMPTYATVDVVAFEVIESYYVYDN